MPQAGFEPAIPASERPQTHAVGGAGHRNRLVLSFSFFLNFFPTRRIISDVVIVILSGMTSSGTRGNTKEKEKMYEPTWTGFTD